jgi:hypothetical protein
MPAAGRSGYELSLAEAKRAVGESAFEAGFKMAGHVRWKS